MTPMPSQPLSLLARQSTSRAHELLRRTFGIEVVCSRCHGPLRLIALLKEAATIAKILGAMGLDTTPPQLASARAPPHQTELPWCN